MPVGNAALITRCPDCLTAFRATAEQLAVREGMVRCGHCGIVFDARANAIDQERLPTPAADAHGIQDGMAESPPAASTDITGLHAPPQFDDDTAAAGDSHSVPPSADADSNDSLTSGAAQEPWVENQHMDSKAGVVEEETEEEIQEAPAEAQAAKRLDMEATAEHNDELNFLAREVTDAAIPPAAETGANTPPPEHEASATVQEQAPPDAPAIPFAPATTTGSTDFGFGRKKRLAAARMSPWFAWPGAMVLLLALVAQGAFHFRGDLALLFPALKPLAEVLCAELDCQVPLPRRAELMSIETSDLQADSTNPGVMVLSAILRNRAPFAQPPPALELTLTDTQDQPVARRVLTAADYFTRGATNSLADALFPAGSEVPVKVFFDASAVKATGYRLYLFYP